MSHIVTITTQVRDAAAVQAACRRLGLPQPVQGSHRLYTSTATGLGVQLPGWRYPVVVDDGGERVAQIGRAVVAVRRRCQECIVSRFEKSVGQPSICRKDWSFVRRAALGFGKGGKGQEVKK